MSDLEHLDVGGSSVNVHVAGSADADAPGVALYHAWWGLNDDVRAFADRLAGAGFHVLAPDMYGGQVTDQQDEAKRLARATDEDTANAIALATIDRLLARPNAPSRVGAIGFSFGVHWAIWVTGQREQVAASVVVYGTTDDRALITGRAPVLGHFAEDDPFEGPEEVKAFEDALREAGRPVTIHLYPDTGHWFTEPSRDAYRAEAADQVFERTVEFFRAELVGR